MIPSKREPLPEALILSRKEEEVAPMVVGVVTTVPLGYMPAPMKVNGLLIFTVVEGPTSPPGRIIVSLGEAASIAVFRLEAG